MGLKNNPHQQQDTIFASILADGKIHVSVSKDTEGAIEREYETSDGKKGSKFEHQYTELSGHILEVKFFEGDYGINLQLVVGEKDDEKPVALSLSTESNFAEDLMKKLPDINLKKPVTMAPYSFDNDKGKKQRGITVTQDGVKIPSHYYDTEKKAVCNGYPVAPKPKAGAKPLTKSQWRKYFDEAREFLMEQVKEQFPESEAEESATDKELNRLGKK